MIFFIYLVCSTQFNCSSLPDKHNSVNQSVSSMHFSCGMVEENQYTSFGDPTMLWDCNEMRKFLFASFLILPMNTCLCEMRKTIKVEKLVSLGDTGYEGTEVPAHYRLEAGDQKEITVCLKFRTFAYRDGFNCPFYISTGLII